MSVQTLFSIQTHNLTTSPSTTVEATKTDLLEMFETMYTMRRMEITCVSGFVQLADFDWIFADLLES
jgi:TPP-dependent pyruvate/acetoin dehydrogenase alpha subunit